MSESLFDCFASSEQLLLAATAVERLRAAADTVVQTESLTLTRAAGRVLAETVKARAALPAFTNVAIDGIALHRSDLSVDSDTVLKLERTIAAGDPPGPAINPGSAARVLTGAPMPPGADATLMQEVLEFRDGQVRIPAATPPGRDWRPAGEDVTAGEAVLAKGQLLRPQDVGMLAAQGLDTIEVYRPLRVALFSNGNELQEPGSTPRAHSLYDVNRYMLAAFLGPLPVTVLDQGILADDFDLVRNTLDGVAGTADLLLTSGGASTGSTDHVARVLEEHGAIHFWRLAIKPGRPLAFGRIGNSPLVGLPGNPVAAAVCFIRFVRPLLLALAGAGWQEPRCLPVAAGFNWSKKPGRREWLRVRCELNEQRQWRLFKHPRHGSGILSSMLQADGLAEVAEDITAVEEGMMLPFLGFDQIC